MSNINDKATVELFVNGEQAEAAMKRLTTHADELRRKIEEARAGGNTKEVNKLQRELERTEKELNRVDCAAKGTRIVLDDLSNKSIRGLKNALKHLQKELDATKPNTEAWKRLSTSINEVKNKIRQLDEESGKGNRIWERFKLWADKSWPAFDLLSRWYGNLIGSLRQLVDAFASMDQEMANVRKFTGMTAEQVASMNTEFKKIDTRTPREELNKLAQEAGRLGKTSQEDVLGFVRAADKINVALDDLGEGATLTLSKLTGVFGDEARYGTEQSLLKVGSVINELSQNCAASAPYLANFAERMGGVGAQAGMTIQQIMGFGAVLDSNSQKVEASATALSQVIVRLYQDPAKYARVAGLEVESFTKLMREDANAALILFLETLQRAGGMDTLSPMFKDMGETGSRAITALSTLATHIDQVKAQQEAANVAFEEGTSIEKEFNVQNTTIQASLEKAKNRFQELRIELGGKLSPLMSHMVTTASALTKAINITVDFVLEHTKTITLAAVAIVTFTAVLKASSIAFKTQYATIMLVEKAQKAWAATLSVMKGAVVAFRVAMIAMTQGVTAARRAWNLFNKTISANPIGAIATVIATLATAIAGLIMRTDKTKESLKRLGKQAAETQAEIKNEKGEIDELFKSLNSARKGSDEYQKAKDEILSKYGKYLSGLSAEVQSLDNVAEAYRIITKEANAAARARGLAAANKEADDSFNSVLSEQGEKLLDALQKAKRKVRYGNSTTEESISRREAGRWLNQIIAEASSGDVSDSTKEFLRSIGVTKRQDGKYRGSGGVDDALNAILEAAKTLKEETERNNDIFGNPDEKYKNLTALEIRRFVEELRHTVVSNSSTGKNGYTGTLSNGATVTLETNNDIMDEIRVLERIAEKLEDADEGVVIVGKAKSKNNTQNTPYESQVLADKQAKKDEMAARRELAKAKTSFKQQLSSVKGNMESSSAENVMNYGAGLKTYEEFVAEKERIDLKYVNDRIEVYKKLYENESDTDKKLLLMYDEEYQQLLLKQAELTSKTVSDGARRSIEELKREYDMAIREKEFEFNSPNSKYYGDSAAQEFILHELKINYLTKYKQQYKVDSKEWTEYEQQIQMAEQDFIVQRQKKLMQSYESWSNEYTTLSADRRYEIEKGIIEELYEQRKISEREYQLWLTQLREKHSAESAAAESATTKSKYTVSGPGGDVDIRSNKEQIRAHADKLKAERRRAEDELQLRFENGIINEDELKEGLSQIRKEYEKGISDPVRSMLYEQTRMLYDLGVAWADFFKSISENGKLSFEDIKDVAAASFATLCAGLQTYSQFVEAEKRIELAALEKRYDREVKMAQGNSYKVAKAEKKKEDEIAKVKAEYAKKEFAVKVIMAVAQTAQNALLGYAAGLEAGFPMAAWLAPLLAGMAAAQGAIQIALIKKQQQAAAAEGYAQGGFTKKGGVNEPAGIVHAGEWVASQKLLSNPVARPMIDALDYAQRTNTIGSLRADDVSRSITANNSLVRIAESDGGSALMAAVASEMSRTVADLTDRLREPFVTVNTVTGDKGIKKAQDEYSRLMNRITPKSKRK